MTLLYIFIILGSSHCNHITRGSFWLLLFLVLSVVHHIGPRSTNLAQTLVILGKLLPSTTVHITMSQQITKPSIHNRSVIRFAQSLDLTPLRRHTRQIDPIRTQQVTNRNKSSLIGELAFRFGSSLLSLEGNANHKILVIFLARCHGQLGNLVHKLFKIGSRTLKHCVQRTPW
jgi:hypothetical protein